MHLNTKYMSHWDYSSVPEQRWEFNEQPIDEGGDAMVMTITVDPSGVSCSLFNYTSNVVTFGGHDGCNGTFEDFLQYGIDKHVPTTPGYYGIRTFLKDMSDDLYNEIKAYIEQHRVAL